MRPRLRPGTTAASAAVRQLRDDFGFTQQQLAVYLGLSIGSIARYETDRTPGAPMLRRFLELARERQRSDLADIFEKELRHQLFEWMGVGAAARAIYKRTLRPEILAEARKRVGVMSEQCKIFRDPLVSRTKAIEAGRMIQRDLIELSSLLIPEGETKSMPLPDNKHVND